MTREETIASLRAGLSAIPPGEARTLAFTAFLQLLAELTTAEDLLDAGYNNLMAALPEQRWTLDRIIFSNRGVKPGDAGDQTKA